MKQAKSSNLSPALWLASAMLALAAHLALGISLQRPAPTRLAAAQDPGTSGLVAQLASLPALAKPQPRPVAAPKKAQQPPAETTPNPSPPQAIPPTLGQFPSEDRQDLAEPEPQTEPPVPEATISPPADDPPEPTSASEDADAPSGSPTENAEPNSNTLPNESGVAPRQSQARDASEGGPQLGSDQSYAAYLLALLEQRKVYPRRARQRQQEGEVLLYVEVDANGSLLARRIERSSGHEILDQAALAMLPDVQSFPPPPPPIIPQRLELVIPVQYKLSN